MEQANRAKQPGMTRLLFAHDHRFLQGQDGRLYSVGSFPASIWDRYLQYFDHVQVIARNGGTLPKDARMAPTTHRGVDIMLLPNLTTLRHLLMPSPLVSRQIREAVSAADAIVARLPSEIGLRAAAEAHALGKPYLIEVVGCAFDAYGHYGSMGGRLFAPLAYLRMQRAIARAPQALYVTSSWLQGRYPTSGLQVGTSDVAIRIMESCETEARETRLRELSQGRVPHLGTVASLRTKTKGIQTAIAAIAMLRREGLEYRYSVLGPGDAAPWQELAYERGVGDLVTFDGTREAGEGVRRWLDGIDIHLQPSFQEGLPRATIEAMSRGIACIGSTCGGIPELLPPERTHRPGDVNGLAQCIRRLATEPASLIAAARTDLDRSNEFEPELLEARRNQIYGALRALVDATRSKALRA